MHNFTYCTDLEQYACTEKWVVPNPSMSFKGDCEDFALACRVECRKLGIASQLVFCYTELGEGHCVLAVSGYILDNRLSEVKNWQNIIAYKWIKISGFEPGDEWRAINSGPV